MANPAAGLPAFFDFWGNRLAVYSIGKGYLASSLFLHSRGIFFRCAGVPVWKEEFEADKTQISFVISMALFTGAITAPILGYCLDRFPWRNVVCLGAAWLLAAQSWGFLSQGWSCRPQLLPCSRGLAGIVTSLIDLPNPERGSRSVAT